MTSSASPLDDKLRAIADPMRRKILVALKAQVAQSVAASGRKDASASKALCAGDIEECMGLSQSTISHHMAILTNAGLVVASKAGQWRWYRRNERALRQLVKSLRREL